MLAAVTLPPNPLEDRPSGPSHELPPPPPGPSHELPFPPPGPLATELPPPPPGHYAPAASDSGTNGLAIAALVCGLAFFVPFAAILAIIFGILALRQIARTFQRGRGMAIAGIVTGSLVVLAWIAVVGLVIASGSSVTTSGAPVATGQAFVDELEPGACFSGLAEESSDPFTVHPCAEPHQAQLITTVTLDGDFPGAEQAVQRAGDRCDAAVEPLLRDDATESLDLYYFGPETALDWRLDRSVQCVLAAADGQMTGSLLK